MFNRILVTTKLILCVSSKHLAMASLKGVRLWEELDLITNIPCCQFCHTLRFLPRRSIADRLLKLVPPAFYPLSIGNIPPDRMILHYRADRWEHPLLIETYDEMAASADRDLLMLLGAQ